VSEPGRVFLGSVLADRGTNELGAVEAEEENLPHRCSLFLGLVVEPRNGWCALCHYLLLSRVRIN